MREEVYRAALAVNRLLARSVDQTILETFSQLASTLVEELGAPLVTNGRLDREDLSIHLLASLGGIQGGCGKSHSVPLPGLVERYCLAMDFLMNELDEFSQTIPPSA